MRWDRLDLLTARDGDVRARSGEAPLQSLQALRAAGRTAVELSGVALLAWPGLTSLLGTARELGFEEIAARVGGIEGVDATRISELVGAGLTGLDVPLAGHDAASFDRYARSPGRLSSLVAALEAALASGLALRLRLLVSMLVADDPEGFARFVARRFPATQRVSVSLPPSDVPDLRRVASILPTAERLGPIVADMLSTLRGADIAARLDASTGIPLCLAPSDDPMLFVRLAQPVPEAHRDVLHAPLRIPACASCAADRQCAGLHPAYSSVQLEQLARPLDTEPRRRLADPTLGPRAERRGRHNRVHAATSFDEFQRFHWDAPRWDVAVAGAVYVDASDVAGLGIDLDGLPPATLVRAPGFSAGEEIDFLAFPPASLIVLAGVLRQHGLECNLRDLAAEIAGSHILSRAQRAALSDLSRVRSRLQNNRDRALDDALDRVADHLSPVDGQIVGLSVAAPDDVDFCCLLASRLKARADVLVVLGGYVEHGAPQILRAHHQVDCIVNGEGEVPLLLLAAWRLGRWPIERIPGVLRREGRRVVASPPVIHDLDVQGPWRPSGLNMRLYARHADFGGRRLFPYFAVKGCPHRCAFCGDVAQGSYRVRDPRLVVRDLSILVHEHGVRDFFFLDNLVNVRPDYLEAFVSALEQAALDIRWTDCCRPSGIRPDMLQRLARVGCVNLTWGVDAGSARLQRLVDKNIDLEACVGLLEAARAAGIRNSVNIILGLPHETAADREETLRFIRRIAPLCHEVWAHRFRYQRHSPLYERPADFGLVRRADGGCDEVGGLSWTARQEQTAQFRAALRTVLKKG